MNRHTGAFWWSQRPRWLRAQRAPVVYDLTGWQVQRMSIRHNKNVGPLSYTTERVSYSWSRAKKVKA